MLRILNLKIMNTNIFDENIQHLNSEDLRPGDVVVFNSDEIRPGDEVIIINSDEVRPGDETTEDGLDDLDSDVDSDKQNSYYILPIILKDKTLFDNGKIKNIEVIEMTDDILIKVSYDQTFEASRIATSEDAFYGDYITENENVVTYKAPEDKLYLCRMIAKQGFNALNTHLLEEYFLNR